MMGLHTSPPTFPSFVPRIGQLVRYWPVLGRPCEPRTGHVQFAAVEYGRVVVWITGKSGYVLASHCELLAEREARS